MDKKVAEIIAASTRAGIRMAGMQSKNMEEFLRQRPPVYKEDAFLRVIEEESIGHNEIISQLYSS
jgi:hypothetical protein